MADALAERELEGRQRHEVAAQEEHFDRLVARAIEGEPACAEAVLKVDRCRHGGRRECWIHTARRMPKVCRIRFVQLGHFYAVPTSHLQMGPRRPDFDLQIW